jgi:hypothetical protein
MESKKQEDSSIIIVPPKSRISSSFNPPFFVVHAQHFTNAAPGLARLMSTIDHLPPNPDAKRDIQNMIIMPELIADKNGNDITWLALRLFLAWLDRRDGKLVIEINEERLCLEELMEFGRAVGAEGYMMRLQRSINILNGILIEEESPNRGLNLRANPEDSLSRIKTDVGEFAMVRTVEEEDEFVFDFVESPQTESDSDWTTNLP